jgi:ABC-2 type transport system permease protein
VRGWIALYAALMRTSIAEQLQYRVANAIWILSAVLEPVVYLAVWTAVAEGQGGSVGSYSEADLAAYFLASVLVNHWTLNWVMWEFQYRIETGQLSFQLLRPIHPLHQDLADNLGYKLVMLVLLVPVTALLAWWFQPRFALEPWAAAALVPVLLLALALRFVLEWVLALAAFWTTRVLALNQIYAAVLLFFAGRFAPTDLLPGPLDQLTWLLPFRWMVAFPVELAIGRIGPREALLGAALQTAWLAAALLALRLVWERGQRRFTAVGS